jgi:hypothetical protein
MVSYEYDDSVDVKVAEKMRKNRCLIFPADVGPLAVSKESNKAKLNMSERVFVFEWGGVGKWNLIDGLFCGVTVDSARSPKYICIRGETQSSHGHAG